MAQDVVDDWKNREFIETVEIAVRKCVDFLNNFHESAKYRLSVVDARLCVLERKLDFLEASLENADPSNRNAKSSQFKGSIFDPQIRKKLIAQNEQKRKQNQRLFNKIVVAPNKSSVSRTIINAPSSQKIIPQKIPQKAQHKIPQKIQHKVQKESVIPPPAPVQKNVQNEIVKKPPPIPIQKQKQPPNPVKINKIKKAASGPGAVPPKPPSPVPGAADPKPPSVPPQPQIPSKPPSIPIKPPQPPVPGASVPVIPAAAAPPPVPFKPAVPAVHAPGAAPHAQWPNKAANQIDILVVTAGDGSVPGGQSAVEIEYTGHLQNGKQFIQHREVIQLGKKQNIKGLEQAVTRIKVGSFIKLWIPSRLAYGARGAGNLIPPNADLTFQLKLHRIVKQ